ncbi:hypothetical protein [Conexibacter sp. CPCC 206217]|uniref:hypothetical protein n=1 Tax=Conexibacter sp. CPCC 206217 TaxID=3064574 RepID=UPI002723587F|nr:hypothetical protein [Conexibacter sp. CPCC 206217]MDO8208978.1 hypothetical protein [Conexibacter sp. CPCC 206217]
MFDVIPTSVLAPHERVAVQAQQYDSAARQQIDEIQRLVDLRLAQGFSRREAVRYVARQLRAAQRGLGLRDLARIEVQRLL